jgi:putative lipoprotein
MASDLGGLKLKDRKGKFVKKPILILMLGAVITFCVAAAVLGVESPDSLNKALLAYFAKTGADPKSLNPHQTAQIDLNGDGHPDALVLLENPMHWCGTGGCTLLVFKGTVSGFKFVSRSSLIRGPVLVSETRTHGWRNLIVEVSGGGIAPKQVALKYTGSKYPPNPSTLPPFPKNQPLTGTKVF